jgi:hypothetical protein
VNVYRLMQRWAQDVRAGTFDGNDGNDRSSGSGLQLGFCPPVDASCVVPATGCTTGYCRRLCDLYAGTPRTLLAGAMIKVIRDRGPGGINQTGLDLNNTFSIVRAVSDNADAALFDAPCVEALDRLPPMLRFESPTPAEMSFVRGTIHVKAVAVDDTDPRPRTSLVGFEDLDGDPADAVALAQIDTAALADGALTVVARATDLAGNTTMIERVLTIDNTAPAVTIDATGFFIDGTTWWTTSATPVLAGTVTDAAVGEIKAVVAGGIEVSGMVSGTSWMILLPPGVIETTGTQIQIVAIDAAGNQSSVTQRFRVDLEAPVLSFQPSTVNDEAAELVTFAAADHNPQHVHAGPLRDLTAAGACPSVTKFSYLLASTGPEYVIEAPGPSSRGDSMTEPHAGRLQRRASRSASPSSARVARRRVAPGAAHGLPFERGRATSELRVSRAHTLGRFCSSPARRSQSANSSGVARALADGDAHPARAAVTAHGLDDAAHAGPHERRSVADWLGDR